MSAGRKIAITSFVVAAVAVAVIFGIRSITADDGASHERELVERIPPAEHVDAVVREWAAAWSSGDADVMQALAVAPAEDLAEKVASFRDGLRITAVRATPRAAEVIGGRATVKLDVALDLEAVGTWTYVGELKLVLPLDAASPADWRVEFGPASLHPALVGGRRLALARSFAPRAQLLAADGIPLTGDGAAPTPALASQLVGRVGTASAAADGRLHGDPVGISGLQAAFDRDLGGSASTDVQLVEGDAVVQVLDHIRGRPPQPVRTSIDLRVQRAVEGVLGTLTQPAGMVAVRPSTGEVVAAVSNPVQGFNRALNGRYPPGSTFKVITSTALLTKGITPDSPTTCPETTTVNGRVFRNAEGAALGDILFRRAFFESCNTAFVQLSQQLEPADVLDAANRFGFNAPSPLEVPAETASYPEPEGPVDLASSAIGQGRVLATPLQMASVAATVAAGARRPPTLRGVDAPVAGELLPDGVAATLQELMRLVVAEGTGTGARLPGEPVAGKTGTAEFGTQRPPRTHAWFIGFRGDLALAVVVEDGGFGGRVAAPLAREVFRQLG